MKTIKYFVMVITAAFLFAGCGGSQVKVPSGMNIPDKLFLSKEGKVYIFSLEENMYSIEDITKAFGHNFNLIATFGLSKGYSYMALVNAKFNNLSGYPINSWDSMKKFINLYHKKHYKVSFYDREALVTSNHPKFKVVFLKERPKGLFVWDLKQLKADTDKYSK